MAVLGYIPKLKSGLALAFGVPFLHDFSIKNVFYYILYQLTKFQCNIFFPSKDIKQNAIKYSYLENYWHHQLRFIFDYPLKQWPIWKKKWDGNTKNLKNEMSFLDQLKACFFHNYLKLVSAIFIKFLFFPPNDSPSKTMKNAF